MTDEQFRPTEKSRMRKIKTPLSCQRSGDDQFDLADGDGVLLMRVRGPSLAQQACILLTYMIDEGIRY